MNRRFRFKQFDIDDSGAAMKVGTDAVLLGCMANAPSPKNILDIGTGSGVIAVQLAQRFQDAQVVALDLDPAAAAQARQNFENTAWQERLLAQEADFLSWHSAPIFDLLVCNPPFYPNSFPIGNPQREMARVQGMLTFEALAFKAWQVSSNDASFWTILPHHLQPSMEKAMLAAGWLGCHEIEIIPVEGKSANRTVSGWSKRAGILKKSSLSIRDQQQRYTAEYLKLTHAFYLFA